MVVRELPRRGLAQAGPEDSGCPITLLLSISSKVALVVAEQLQGPHDLPICRINGDQSSGRGPHIHLHLPHVFALVVPKIATRDATSCSSLLQCCGLGLGFRHQDVLARIHSDAVSKFSTVWDRSAVLGAFLAGSWAWMVLV